MPRNGPQGLAPPVSFHLDPGLKKGKLFQAGMDSNVLVALTRKVKKVDDSLRGSNTRLIRTINDRAKANLRANILRPKEHGEGQDRGRQTQNWTFGQSGAFRARTGERNGNEIGFGYPDVPIADNYTNYVWRVLEFGLTPRMGQAQPGILEPALASGLAGRFGPQGVHKLPAKFGFTTRSPRTSRMLVFKGPALASGSILSVSKREGGHQIRVNPHGVYGKFFLTRAIQETVVDAKREYTRAVTEAFRNG